MLVFRLSRVLDKPFKLVQTIIFPYKHAAETRRRKKKRDKKQYLTLRYNEDSLEDLFNVAEKTSKNVLI